MKAVVAAFNQEKALVGALSVITNPRMDIFEALLQVVDWADSGLYTCKTNTGPSRQETFQVTIALASTS